MNTRKTLTLAIVACVILSAAPSRATAAPAWLRVTSPNFVIYTDAGEKRGRAIAERLEGFRALLLSLFPAAVAKAQPEPLPVVAFKNDGEFKPYKALYNGKPASMSGVFLGGSERSLVALDASAYESSYRVVFHEYIHKLMSARAFVPPWFNEGMAEFYSTATTKGLEAQLGSPIENHIYYLRDHKMMPLEQLFAVTHDSTEYNEREKQGVFYAQSWLFVHYFMFSENMNRGRELSRFIERLSKGDTPAQAFPTAFGMDIETAEKQLQAYVRRQTFPQFNITFKSVTPVEQAQVEPARESDLEYYLGSVLSLQKRYADAEPHFRHAAELDPASSLPYEGLGYAALHQDDTERARAAFAEAIKRDSKSYMAQYLFASASMRTATSITPPGVKEALEKAVALNPAFVPPYYMLASIAMGKQNAQEATEWTNRGLKVAPQDGHLRYMLASAQMTGGQYDLARTGFRQILNTEDDEQLRGLAKSALEALDRYEEAMKAANATTRPADSASTAEPAVADDGRPHLRRGDPEGTPLRIPVRPANLAEVKGVLKKLECVGSTTTAYVQVGDRLLTFTNGQAEAVVFQTMGLVGEENIECGASIDRAVTILFEPGTGAPETGVLRTIVFTSVK